MDIRDKPKRSKAFLLIGIIVLGVILRCYSLDKKSIWYDESCSIANAQKTIEYFICSENTFKYKILYFLILKCWIMIFGLGEFAMRILSVVFGILSIYWIYRLVLLFYKDKIALYSAFLLALSAFHVYHSQQVRHHSLIVLITILSFYFFAKLFLKQKQRYILLNIIVNFLLMNTYPYGIMIVLVQFILLLTFFKDISIHILRKWIIFQLITVMVYLILFLFPALSYVQEKTWWISRPNISILGETFLTFMFGGARYGLDDYKVPEHLIFAPMIFSLSFIYLFLRGGKSILFLKKKNFSNILFLSWFFIPLLTVYFFSYLKPVFLVKHQIYLLPPFLIIVAKEIKSIKKLIPKICLAVMLISTSFLPLYGIYNYDGNINWQQPAKYIYENKNFAETIMVSTSKEILTFLYYFDYYNKDRLREFEIYGKKINNRWEDVFKYKDSIIVGLQQNNPNNNVSLLNDFLDKFKENRFFWRDRNIWLAVSRWGECDDFFNIEKILGRSHKRVMKKEFFGVTVFYYQKL